MSELLSCSYESPLGMLTLAAGEDGLHGLWIEGQKYFANSINDPLTPGTNEHLDQAIAWLDRYFANEQPTPDELTLAPVGSPFQQTVWNILQGIPYGATMTYAEVAREAAKQLGKERMSAQAAGGAIGHNPISIIIPCHRVIASNGSLTGYAGGLDKKRYLLIHEGVELPKS